MRIKKTSWLFGLSFAILIATVVACNQPSQVKQHSSTPSSHPTEHIEFSQPVPSDSSPSNPTASESPAISPSPDSSQQHCVKSKYDTVSIYKNYDVEASQAEVIGIVNKDDVMGSLNKNVSGTYLKKPTVFVQVKPSKDGWKCDKDNCPDGAASYREVEGYVEKKNVEDLDICNRVSQVPVSPKETSNPKPQELHSQRLSLTQCIQQLFAEVSAKFAG